ncbi:hypothetical protein Tco_0335120 [Tanacetum coccineum]
MSLKAYVHQPPDRFCFVYDYVPTGSLEDAMNRMRGDELQLGKDPSDAIFKGSGSGSGSNKLGIREENVPIPNVADEAVFKEWDDRVVRATTTTASLDAAQASVGVIAQTRSERASKHSYDSPLSGINILGSNEERIEQHEMTDNIPPTPHDSPLSGGYTLRSDKGRPDLHELMAICTKLSDKVLDLEREKGAQAVEILKLKNRIKKLERKAKSSIPPPKRRLYKHVDSSDDSLGEENASKQGRNNSNKTKEFNLSDKGSGGTEVFDDTTAAEKDVNVAELISTAGDAVTTANVIPDIDTAGPSSVSAAGLSTSTARDIFKDEMMTIADTLMAIRSTRLRTTSVVIRDVELKPRRATSVPTIQSQDKGKSKIVEHEPTPKNPIKSQIQRDAEIAQRLFEEDQAHSGLVQNQAVSASAKPPTKNDWDLLFQLMFDEYFKPPTAVSTPIYVVTLLPPDTAEASPSSTSIDKDAPSLSISPNNETKTSQINSTNVEQPHNKEVAEFDSDTFTNPFAPLVTSSAKSSSRIVDTLNMHTFRQPHVTPKDRQRIIR